MINKKIIEKKLFFVLFFILVQIIYGQVGIDTNNPRGALDINNPTTHNMGLVLPANPSIDNIINPQGGDVAEGTIIFDNTLKCARVFNGSLWSPCLGEKPTPVINAECKKEDGFQGLFTNGEPLSDQYFKVTISNNSFSSAEIFFQESDLDITGTEGIKVSSVTPKSFTINSGQAESVVYKLSGAPTSTGIINGSWKKLSLSCKSTTDVKNSVRLASWSDYSLGSKAFIKFNSQLNPNNYGYKGTHKADFSKIVITDVTSSLSTLTADELIKSFDIISTGSKEIDKKDAEKLKKFVEAGKALIVALESGLGTTLFNIFGGKGNIGTGLIAVSPKATDNEIIKGPFGDSRGETIQGYGTYGDVRKEQLPEGSLILAEDNDRARVFFMGPGQRVAMFWDEGAFRDNSVVPNQILGVQSIFLNNIISALLRKIGY